MTTTVQYNLSQSGEVATLSADVTSGDCPLVASWSQDQWYGPGSDTVYLNPDYSPSSLCAPPRICLTPCLIYAAGDDGFAPAEETFDQSEQWLEFANDKEQMQFWGMSFDLTAAIPKGTLVSSAYLEFRTITDVTAQFTVTSVDDLPEDAPAVNIAIGAKHKSVNGRFVIPLTDLIREVMRDLDDGGALESLSLLIQIRPTGTSGNPVRVASSRHATLLGPRLIVVL